MYSLNYGLRGHNVFSGSISLFHCQRLFAFGLATASFRSSNVLTEELLKSNL